MAECSNSGELWSFNEAKHKCVERYSCFVEVKAKEHMSLSPFYIGRIKEGVQEEIERKIHRWKFLDEYQGIIVSYSNLKLLQKSAEIHEDTPFLHFDIQVNYVIFQPEIGKKLIGVVNKTSSTHVGCLVHGRFNASLAKPKACLTSWIGSKLDIGTEFVFRVASLQSVAGVLAINGEVKDKDCKHFRHAQQEPLEDSLQLDTPDYIFSTQQNNLSEKKKKRKDKDNKINNLFLKSEDGDGSCPETPHDNFMSTENDHLGSNKSVKTFKIKKEKVDDENAEGDNDKNNNTNNGPPHGDMPLNLNTSERNHKEKKKHKHLKDDGSNKKLNIKTVDNSENNGPTMSGGDTPVNMSERSHKDKKKHKHLKDDGSNEKLNIKTIDNSENNGPTMSGGDTPVNMSERSHKDMKKHKHLKDDGSNEKLSIKTIDNSENNGPKMSGGDTTLNMSERRHKDMKKHKHLKDESNDITRHKNINTQGNNVDFDTSKQHGLKRKLSLDKDKKKSRTK